VELGQSSERPISTKRGPWIAARTSVGRDYLLLAVAVVAGIALRVWMLRSPVGRLDSDEAIVGLMARRLLGGHVDLFFLGQSYGGAQEPALVGLVYALARSHYTLMKLVPVSLSAVAAVLVWRIGRRTVDEAGGRLAGALFWCAPVAFVWQSTKEWDFYGSTVVLSLAAMLFALRLHERAGRRDGFLLGCSIGFGFYASAQSLWLIIPTLAWLITGALRAGRRDLVRLWWIVLGGAVVGLIPWMLGALQQGSGVVSQPVAFAHTTYLERLRRVFELGLPVTLGLRVPYSGHWIVPVLAPALYVSLLIIGVIAIARRWIHPLLATCVATFPFLVAVPRLAFRFVEPRYLYLLSPMLLLFAFGALAQWLRIAVAGAMVVMAVFGTASLISWSPNHPEYPELAPPDVQPLIHALERQHVDTLFADYWIAYRIDLLTGTRIVAASTNKGRYPPYQRYVRASPSPAFVISAQPNLERALVAALRQRAIAFRRVPAGPYTIYLPDRPIMPEELGIRFR
jgi:hypothetical protein